MNTAKNLAFKIAVAVARSLLLALRCGSYLILSALRPLVGLVSVAVAGVGTFMFLGLLVMHEQAYANIMWGSAAAVVAASAFRLGFDAVLQGLAPPGTVFIS
jgi:hypothetical protein